MWEVFVGRGLAFLENSLFMSFHVFIFPTHLKTPNQDENEYIGTLCIAPRFLPQIFQNLKKSGSIYMTHLVKDEFSSLLQEEWICIM